MWCLLLLTAVITLTSEEYLTLAELADIIYAIIEHIDIATLNVCFIQTLRNQAASSTSSSIFMSWNALFNASDVRQVANKVALGFINRYSIINIPVATNLSRLLLLLPLIFILSEQSEIIVSPSMWTDRGAHSRSLPVDTQQNSSDFLHTQLVFVFKPVFDRCHRELVVRPTQRACLSFYHWGWTLYHIGFSDTVRGRSLADTLL